MTSETGPIYGVELLRELPLGKSNMRQAMPTLADLVKVKRISERTVAGFEVLTHAFRESKEKIELLEKVILDLKANQ